MSDIRMSEEKLGEIMRKANCPEIECDKEDLWKLIGEIGTLKRELHVSNYWWEYYMRATEDYMAKKEVDTLKNAVDDSVSLLVWSASRKLSKCCSKVLEKLPRKKK